MTIRRNVALRHPSGAAWPRLSICVPTFNRASLLQHTLESCLAQDYPNLEIVVGDNASTDGTEAVCRRHMADPRIRVYRSERNLGATANVRALVRHYSTGDYTLVLCDDDRLIDPSYLSKAAALLRARQHDPLMLVFSNTATWNDEHHQAGRSSSFKLPPVTPGRVLFERWWQSFGGDTVYIPFLTCLFHRATANALFAFEHDVMAGDTMLWWKLLLLGDAGFIDTVAGLYRIHQGNDSTTASLERHLPNLRMFVEPARLAAQAGFDLGWLRAWKFRMASVFLTTIAPPAVRRAFQESNVREDLMALYKRAHEQQISAAIEETDEDRILANAHHFMLRWSEAAPRPTVAGH